MSGTYEECLKQNLKFFLLEQLTFTFESAVIRTITDSKSLIMRLFFNLQSTSVPSMCPVYRVVF